MKAKILISLASLVFTLVLVAVAIEFYTRWEEAQYHKEMEAKYHGRELCVRRSDNPKLIYELIPGKCSTNSFGQRDVEHTTEKPDSVFRIAVIGDSVTEGLGVEMEESYPRKLEAMLNADSSGTRYEVIKFAVRGYNITQEIELLKQALRYDPDLVVWGYVLNDPAHPVFHSVNAELGRYFYRPRSYFVHWLKRKLFFARERRLSRECPDEYHARLHCIHREDLADNLTEIKEIAHSAGVDILFTTMPVFEKEGYKNYSLNEVHEDLASMATARGMVVLDMLDTFKQYDNSQLRTGSQDDEWFDPWHPGPFGHQLIAAELAKKIEQLN